MKKRFDSYNEELENKVKSLEYFREQKLVEERAIKKKAKRDLQKEAKLKAVDLKSIRTATKFLDNNENETRSVVIKDEKRVCDIKEETKNVDKDSVDVESEPESKEEGSSEEISFSTNELKQNCQNNMATLEKIIEFETECEESATIRAITEAVCEDLIKKLIVPDDT